MGTRGRVRLGASRQIRMGCTIWEATCGSGVRIGTIRRTLSACCAVRRGTITTRIVCLPLTAAITRPIVAALTPVFVVLSLGILRGKASAPSPKSLGFRCVQNGSSARREEGAYLDRYVTDEQRSSRPIFNATLRAAASWLFFRVARSTVMMQIAALRSRLEKQPTELRRNPRDLGDGALACIAHKTGEITFPQFVCRRSVKAFPGSTAI